MTPEESNRILTGLLFTQVKADRLLNYAQDASETPQVRWNRALRVMQRACTEAMFLESTPMQSLSSHTTSEMLLADALLQVLGQAHACNLQLGSAVLKQLDRYEKSYANAHDQNKDLKAR